MKDCLTFFGGTSIFYSRGNKFKKTSIVIIPITQTKTSKSHSHFIPVGVQLGLERLSAHLQILWKYKKTADFLRNQRLNMVAGTGLEPAASGLWGSLKGKSESFRLRFVLFTTVRSADFPLFPSRPARFFRILGQKWVRSSLWTVCKAEIPATGVSYSSHTHLILWNDLHFRQGLYNKLKWL